MFLDPLGAIATLINGYRTLHAAEEKADGYFNFCMSLMGTLFVTFTGTWGVAGLGVWATSTDKNSLAGIIIAVMVGFLTALTATAAVFRWLWGRSPYTRGIPLAVPASVEKAAQEGSFNMVIPGPPEKRG